MFHHDHQLVANFVCLQLGVGQVTFSGVSEAVCWLLWLEMRLMRVNVLGGKPKQKTQNKPIKQTKMLQRAERNCRVGFII